jgi:hypothetical protein
LRIGFVVPWIHGIGANKIVFSLAAELSKQGHDVEVFCLKIRSDLPSEVERMLGGAHLSVKELTNRGSYRRRYGILWNLWPGYDRHLARFIAQSHRRSGLDVLLLVANEGHGLARILRRSMGNSRPLLGWSVMELIDHSYLLRAERDFPTMRSLLGPLYPAVHWAWSQSLAAYDFLCANSTWTATLLEYLYGVQCGRVVISIPVEAFEPGETFTVSSRAPYVAVPTASVSRAQHPILQELAASGMNLVSYGPRQVPGTLHLGYLSEEKMRSVLSGAAATLFLFDYEGLGLIPFESIAVGTPVVTLPKHAVHMQWSGNPYVTFASNAQGLAEACNRWLTAPPSREERTAARSTIAQYAAPKAAENLVSFLSDKRLVSLRS